MNDSVIPNGSDDPFKVIILGAGVAGLAAANNLYHNGITNILLIEAKDKPGGRIQTEYIESEDKNAGIVELGAQWIHGEDNSFFRLISRSDHIHGKTSWEGKGSFLLPNGKKVDDSLVKEVLEWVENRIEYVEETLSVDCMKNYCANKPNMGLSMGDFLSKSFEQYLAECVGERDLREAIFQWAMSFQRIDNSCNKMADLSLFRWSEFAVNPGELYNNFMHGASRFVDEVLVKSLPHSIIKYSSPVETISWNEEQVQIKTATGHLYRSEAVVVTCSIGVLKSTKSTLFSPQLPVALSEAIDSTGFGPIAKIFLKWDIPWWPKELQGYQFIWPKEFIDCCEGRVSEESLDSRWPKSITGFDPVLDNPNILLGWLGGPEAAFVEGLDSNEVGKRCANILGDFTGCDVPVPDKVFVSQWNSDEYFRGAYSFRAVEGDAIHGDITAVLCTPVYKDVSKGQKKPTIILAGEALSKSHYSTLHGAFESGESQSAKILAYFRSTEISNSNSKAESEHLPKRVSESGHDKDTLQTCSNESRNFNLKKVQTFSPVLK